MQYYKEQITDKLYAYDDGVNYQDYTSETLTPITKEEYEAIIAPTFEQLQTSKVQELYAAYESDNQQDIDYMATTFQADKDSQDIMGQVLAVGSVPAEFYWLDLSNNKIAMTCAELQGLAGSILTRSQINFDKLQTLKEEVLVATTQEELELIVW